MDYKGQAFVQQPLFLVLFGMLLQIPNCIKVTSQYCKNLQQFNNKIKYQPQQLGYRFPHYKAIYSMQYIQSDNVDVSNL